MESATEAKLNGEKSQPSNQQNHLSTDQQLAEYSSIAQMCAAITQLVHAVNKTDGADRKQPAGFSDEPGELADALWEQVCEFAEQLARARSSSLDDVKGKISIWRHLAPEPDAGNKYPTFDEMLLLSIIGDVEQLRRSRAS